MDFVILKSALPWLPFLLSLRLSGDCAPHPLAVLGKAQYEHSGRHPRFWIEFPRGWPHGWRAIPTREAVKALRFTLVPEFCESARCAISLTPEFSGDGEMTVVRLTPRHGLRKGSVYGLWAEGPEFQKQALLGNIRVDSAKSPPVGRWAAPLSARYERAQRNRLVIEDAPGDYLVLTAKLEPDGDALFALWKSEPAELAFKRAPPLTYVAASKGEIRLAIPPTGCDTARISLAPNAATVRLRLRPVNAAGTFGPPMEVSVAIPPVVKESSRNPVGAGNF